MSGSPSVASSAIQRPVADDLDWLIVGGGIHGVHLAVRLLAEGGVAPERLRILDPAPRLLEEWRRTTANTGMEYLRSPAVHHLDLDPWSLLRFAGSGPRRRRHTRDLFAPPYGRPSLELFAAHCDDVIARHGVPELHVRGRATRIELSQDGAVVQTDGGEPVTTRRVLLAIGSGGQPRWPEWASPRPLDDELPVRHVFEPDFVLQPGEWGDRVAVVGGGITAAQVALRLAETRSEVHLVARHELRKHQFDTDPGWVGPKNMRRFVAVKCLRERREMIRQARYGGSVPPDVHRALRTAIERGSIVLHRAEPRALSREPPGLDLGNDRIHVDGVLLATGFVSQRPGGALVDSLIEAHELPCAPCGYPVVNTDLQWGPALFVSGTLAELELGPVSRNIAGARRAAERIVAFARYA